MTEVEVPMQWKLARQNLEMSERLIGLGCQIVFYREKTS